MIKQVRALKPPSGQYGDTSNEMSPLLYSLFTTATHIATRLQNVLLSIRYFLCWNILEQHIIVVAQIHDIC